MLTFVKKYAPNIRFLSKEKYLLRYLHTTNDRAQNAMTKVDTISGINRGAYLIEPKYFNLSYAMSNSNGLHLMCDTFADRIEIMAKHKPDQICYKFAMTRQQITFLEIKQRIDEIAQNFLDMGFKKGDRIAVFLPNIPENNLTVLAAASIGLIVVMMNPAYQLVEVQHMLKKTKAKGIIMLDNLKVLQHYEMLKKICPELESSQKGELNSQLLPDLKHVIIANNGLFKDPHQQTKGTWNFKEIEKFNGVKREKPRVDMDDSLVILFTSGTTGFPKGAVLTHSNLINSTYLEAATNNLVDANRIICCPIPLFHIFGLIVGGFSPLVFGSKTVFPSFFPDTLSTIKAIASEKCTSIKAAPIIFIDILNHPERKNYDLSSLEYMLIGASTVPKDLLIKLKQELKFKYIISGLGMTETAAAGLITRPRDLEISEKYAYESIGQPLPFCECKIIDHEGNMVPHNTDGELCIRGYNIMKEYWDEPIKTAETIDASGWLKTGDICSMDENGYVFFKSRAKEVIIRGGINIYPAEIESFFRTHESILDAYCFGVSDERVGEEVCIWIKLKPNAKVSKDDLTKFCDGKIAFFKIPKHIKFVENFPISANGKVQKFKMSQQMKQELSA